ncbi:MAG TPA: acyl-CoA thioesterase [Acidimicrobiales bacterium]|nr:acyl-CoA thioesterase [Acidimicrobiales bacterium]
MHTVPFLGLEPTEDPAAWRLPVVQALATGGGFLFGGAGLGAAVAAMERTSGRPLVWATAQYLSFARPPDVVDVRVTLSQVGNATTQARAVATVGDQEIFTVNGALGSRDVDLDGQWAEMPTVLPPDDCPPRQLLARHTESIMSRIESRLAIGRQRDDLDGQPTTDGRSALWARVPGLDTGAALLGILGDYVPFGVGQALGAHAGGRSLDNTIRIVRIVPTDWVLLDIRVQAVASGYGHGLVHLWAEDGTLLATASQTCAVRRHRP